MRRIIFICIVLLNFSYCLSQTMQDRMKELQTMCDTLYSFSALYNDLLLFSDDEKNKWKPPIDDFFTQLNQVCIGKFNTLKTLFIKYNEGNKAVESQLNTVYRSVYDALKDLEKKFGPTQHAVEERYNQLATGGTIDSSIQKVIDEFKATCGMFTSTLQALFKITTLFPETDRIATNTQINNGIKEISDACAQSILSMQKQHMQIKATSDISEQKSLFTAVLFYQDEHITAFNNISSTIVMSVRDRKAALDRAGAIARAEEDLKNRSRYHQKIINFYNELNPHIDKYNAIAKSARELIQKEINTGKLDIAQLSALLGKFKEIAGIFLSIYKKYDLAIHADDLSNYAISAYRNMIGLCCDDIAVSVDSKIGTLTDAETKQEIYDHFASLAIRVLGSDSKKLASSIFRIPSELYTSDNEIVKQGYDTILGGVLKNFTSLYKEYSKRKKRVSFTVYQNVLQDLSLTVTRPQERDFGYAQLFFEKLDEDLNLLLPAIATQFRQKYAQLIANIGFAYVQTIFSIAKSDSENQTLRDEAIKVFQVIASYFKRADDKKNENKYQGFAQMIVDAQNALVAARTEIDNDKARVLFQQAFEKFAQVGDARDATSVHLEMQERTVNSNQKAGADALTNYVDQHDKWYEYLEAIGTLYSAFLLDNTTDSLFSDLAIATVKSRDFYTKSYDAQQKIYDSVTTSTRYTARGFDIVSTILDNINKAMQPLLDGTNAARRVLEKPTDESYVSEQLNTAEQYFDSARKYLTAVDVVWMPYFSTFVPIYPSVVAAHNQDVASTLKKDEPFTFMKMCARHIASLYIAIARAIENQNIVSAIQFYSTAKAYSPYLPDSIANFLEKQVRSYQEKQDMVVKIFQDAQEKQKKAHDLTEKDWEPLQSSGIYESKATQIWQHVFDLYISALQAWYEEAEKELINAVNIYAEAYQKHVPARFYPELSIAMIYYYQFVMYHKHNFPLKEDEVLKKMNPLVTAFLDELEKHSKVIAMAFNSNDISFIETATTSQTNLENRLSYLTAALNDQKHIRDSLARSDDHTQDGFWLLTMTVDTTTNTQIISYEPTKKSITFSQLAHGRADLYRYLAEKAFEQGKNDVAFIAFQEANKEYHNLGMDGIVYDLEAHFQLAKTRALADKYRSYVIPNAHDSHGIAATTIAGISVPERYEIAVYEQQWPADLSIAADIIEYAKNPGSSMPNIIKDELINMSAQLYYYQALKDYNIAYQDAAGLAKTGSEDIKELLDELAKKSNSFKSDLTTRVNANQSKVYLRGEKGDFYIGIVYLPVIGVPLKISELPYSRFPYAYLFYSAAFKLYGTEQISIHGVTYMPGNDATAQQSLVADMADTHISDAQRIKKEHKVKIDSVISTVKKVSKTNFSIDLASYADDIENIKSLYNDILSPHYYNAQVFYKNIDDKVHRDSLKNERAAVYVELVELLSNFLIGDPLADSYQNLLWNDLDLYYKFAVNIYQDPKKTADLFVQYAALKIAGGDLLIQIKKNYFAAFTFYGRAYQTLRSIVQPDQKLIDKIRDAQINIYAAAFHGATKNILEYAQAKKSVSLEDGTIMTLQDLIAKNHADGSYIEVYNKYKKIILDALIFYSYVSTAASKMMYPDSADQPKMETSDQQADDPLMKNSQDAVTNYMQDHALTFSGVDEIIAFLWQDNAESIINGIFDSSATEIKQSADGVSMQKGYGKIFVWIDRLYLIFSQLYMHDFLAGVLPKDLWTQLSADIKAEAQDIGSPSSQYL